jgi:hypothetical protein
MEAQLLSFVIFAEFTLGVIGYARDSRITIILCILVDRELRDATLSMLYKDLVVFCGNGLDRFLACYDREAVCFLIRLRIEQ